MYGVNLCSGVQTLPETFLQCQKCLF